MNNTITLMMDLIKNQICNQPLGNMREISETELNSLYDVSKKHDISQLLVSPLEDLSALNPDYSVSGKFKKALFSAVYRYEKSNYELKAICDLFGREGIDHIALKGSVIRNYYPLPYLRTSCDIDILVKTEEVERATELLIKQLQYTLQAKGEHDISLNAPSGVHIELHFKLLGQDFKEAKTLREIWESDEIIENSPHHFQMSNELFLLYHIYHSAKHFMQGGCGIKPVIDLWILKNKVGYDEDKATLLLKESELLDFYHGMIDLTNVWLGEREHTLLTAEMETYILQGGVYGILEQQIAIAQTKKGGKSKYLLSRIFMPYQFMVNYYPTLKKFPWLFPLFQIRRWCRIIFCGRGKYALHEIKLNQNLPSVKKESTTRLMKKLGL